MKMKVFLAVASGLMLASAAHAATITFALTGSGGNFQVTAADSTGDNFGIASFTVTLATGSYTSLTNVSPIDTFQKSTTPFTIKTVGFTTLRSVDTDPSDPTAVPNPVTGSQDTTNVANTRVYGIGQTSGSLTSFKPSGYNELGGYTSYSAPVVIATGTYTGTLPTLVVGAGNVFQNNTVTTPETTAASIVLNNPAPSPEPASLTVLGLSGVSLLARRRKAVTA